LAANRHLRDVLIAKGYAVRYEEVYCDHDRVRWRRALPDALIATLGVRDK
jgi:enterochelin esterase family protein